MKTQKIQFTKTHTHTPLNAVYFGFHTKRKDKFIMSVFRVEKAKDYTVIHELEQAGYITCNRIRNEKGQLREMEYTVYSSPKLNDNYGNKPIMENPAPDNPTLEFPTQGKPTQ